MGNIADDDESNFDAFLGGFGSHANIKKRQKAENMAALPPSDGRRKRVATRTRQLNVRVSEQTWKLVGLLVEKFSERDGRSWSQPDVVEAAIAAIAKAEKIKT